MKEIDDYADRLGIELIPCIQTLGASGTSAALAGVRRGEGR
jgi:hypothetical protein